MAHRDRLFGLGTGYFIWGGQALFGYPKAGPEIDRTSGMWGFWMPGFCQFLTGVYLMVGLTWFNVFGNAAPLYMAGVAFTVYGVHWFAMAHRRYVGSSAAPDGWMAIAYLFVSALGTYVFGKAGDVPSGTPSPVHSFFCSSHQTNFFRSLQGRPAGSADYRPYKDAEGDDALAGDKPFMLHADGVGWIWAPKGLADGPLPTHYEPLESPVRNPFYPEEQNNPAVLKEERPQNEYANSPDARFPFVMSTYRLTEHHTSGAMSRMLPHLAELQPEFFCEISPELAKERGVENGG